MLSVRSFKNKNNKIFILYFFFWRIIYWILGNFYTSGFFLSPFKYFSLLLTCMVSQEKSHTILILLPLLSFFPLWHLSSYSASLIFCSLNIISLVWIVLYLYWLVFSELPGFVCWCLSLVLKNLGHYYFRFPPPPVLFPYLFLVFLLYVCYTFCNCPTVFGYSDSLKPIF